MFFRSVFADFTESKILEDMRIFRFEANEKLFRYEEENFCFCPRGIAKTGEEHDPVNCPPNGLLNLALFSCKFLVELRKAYLRNWFQTYRL